MQNQTIVLCIPKLSFNISSEYIINIIQKMNIGTIDTLHEIPLKYNKNYKRIIMRINWNLESSQSKRIYSILNENKSIKIVYDMPWYWVCVKYIRQNAKERINGLDPSLSKLIENINT
uniref:Uncharacterized protein n=1 Tax=viral metagenome TaxID=1070528 RepID=A0A6C0JWR9_9ZZZZ